MRGSSVPGSYNKYQYRRVPPAQGDAGHKKSISPSPGALQDYGALFDASSAGSEERTGEGHNANKTPGGGHGHRWRIGLAGTATLVLMVAAKITVLRRQSAEFERGRVGLRTFNLAEVGGSGRLCNAWPDKPLTGISSKV